MKTLVVGMMRHGKDTLAEYLGVSYESSSVAALNEFLFDRLNLIRLGIGIELYRTHDEAYEDRHNHRALWHKEISFYNRDDRARLAKKILEKNDCYVGMRCKHELAECIKLGLFDKIYWVDASDRKPPEPSDSMSIEYDPKTMIWVDNNGSEKELMDNAMMHRRMNIHDAKHHAADPSLQAR